MSSIEPHLLSGLEELLDLVGPLRLRNCPFTPTFRQEAFLRLTCPEALFGGAAGGGKSVALLTAAAQFTDVPGYNALLLRTTPRELEQPGGLIDLAEYWFGPTKAQLVGRAAGLALPGRNPQRCRVARQSASATSTASATSAATPAARSRLSGLTSSPRSMRSATGACSVCCGRQTPALDWAVRRMA